MAHMFISAGVGAVGIILSLHGGHHGSYCGAQGGRSTFLILSWRRLMMCIFPCSVSANKGPTVATYTHAVSNHAASHIYSIPVVRAPKILHATCLAYFVHIPHICYDILFTQRPETF